MNENRKSVEFNGTIDKHGHIRVPRPLLKSFEGDGNKNVHIRLTGKVIASTLRKKNVSEEEIESMAGLQMTSHDQVVKFLLSEGALAKHKAFHSRSMKRTAG